jgi:hypothetical protein
LFESEDSEMKLEHWSCHYTTYPNLCLKIKG